MQTPGVAGSCTCLSKTNPNQLCDSVGEPITPAPPLLKLLNLYSTQPASDLYLWSASALIPASQVKSAKCVQVISETGGLVSMALADSMFPSTVSPASRRLMAETNHTEQSFMDYPDVFTSASPPDHLAQSLIHSLLVAPGWNSTAAPCSTVVIAYQEGRALSPGDEATAHSCAYWRHVGQLVIQRFNLTALNSLDTFLLSADDFSAALGHQGVMHALVTHPKWFVTAAMYSSWLKPVRAAFWLHYHQHFRTLFDGVLRNKLQQWGASTLESAAESIGGAYSHTRHIKRRARRNVTRDHTSPPPAPRQNHTRPHPASNRTFVKPPQRYGRRLLDTTTNVIAAVRSTPYYMLFSRNSPTASDATYMTGEGSCPPAEVALSTGIEIAHVTGTYYSQFGNIIADRHLSTSLWDVLPNLDVPEFKGSPPHDYSSGSYYDATVRAVFGIFGVSMEDLVTILTSASEDGGSTLLNTIQSLTTCDFPSLMYCQNHTKDVFNTYILAVLLYMALASLTGYFGIPIVSTLFWYSIPFAVLWYSYGVSPTCFPMISPCFADDILSQLAWIFPPTTSLPPALLCYPNSTSCLVSCTTLGFTSWEDPVAFAAAALGIAEPLAKASWVQGALSLLSISDIAGNLRRKEAMVASADVSAYATCAVVTAVSALPVILALGAAVAVAGSVLAYGFSLSTPIITLMWQVVSFGGDVGERGDEALGTDGMGT